MQIWVWRKKIIQHRVCGTSQLTNGKIDKIDSSTEVYQENLWEELEERQKTEKNKIKEQSIFEYLIAKWLHSKGSKEWGWASKYW